MDIDPDIAVAVLAHADDAVLVADGDGTIRYWNAAAERIFGWTSSEAVGQTLDLIVPERHRERHWDGWHRVASTGETAYAGKLLAVPAQTKDGASRSIEFTVNLVPSGDAARPVHAVAAIIRDVSERRAADKATREELEALRRRA